MADEKTISNLKEISKDLRINIIKMLYKSQSGHPGGSLSSIDIITALYFYKLNVYPKEPKKIGRDIFIMSKGHASPAVYVALCKKGFFPIEELWNFRQINSLLQGHVDIKVPGVEFSGGSLGMGLSFGNGYAIAKKIDNQNYKVVVLMGDGEQQEGEVWEAAMSASHHKLDIIAIIDRNGIQNDGFVDKTKIIEPLADKWKAFGWNVLEGDGHDFNSITKILDQLWEMKGPRVAILKTVKGKGVSFMENNPDYHHVKNLSDSLYHQALEELNAK